MLKGCSTTVQEQNVRLLHDEFQMLPIKIDVY